MEERDKGDPPFCFIDSNSVLNWMMISDIDAW
jgi:hypothetical protein